VISREQFGKFIGMKKAFLIVLYLLLGSYWMMQQDRVELDPAAP
jgi:hypothetical protein